MNQKNIPETYALKGGTQGWKSAGYPMEGTGSNPVPAGKDAVPNPPVVSSNNPAPQNY
jgi:3-mercaptopyruvate sulfurtransferase SseA